MQGWEWLTAARVITHKPCRLLELVITPSGATSEIKVYDGENTDSPIILEAILKYEDTKQLNFPGGLQTARGLYIGSFTDITGVLVRWEVD